MFLTLAINSILIIIITCFIIIIVVTMIIFVIICIFVLRPDEQAAGGCFSLLLEDPSPSAGSTGRRSDHNHDHYYNA